MKKRAIKPVRESIDNVDKVINGDIDVVATVDINTANAIEDNKNATAHKDEVKKELDDRAKDVTPKNTPEFGKMDETMYTKKYTLDESLQDFKLSDIDH